MKSPCEKNETKEVNYTIKATKSGNLTYSIGVIFISEEQRFGLQSTINLTVYPKEKRSVIEIIFVITLLVIAFAFVIVLILLKLNK